jgi:hypothetical protein
MLDGVASWASAGAVSVPVWVIFAGLGLIIGALALRRATLDGSSVPLLQGALVVAAVVAGWWALDHVEQRNLAVERRNVAVEQQAVEARMLDLATRALAPGSALACLDAMAGDAVEDACEKAVFGSPEATAAAVSYVAAQLSLLAQASAQRSPSTSSTATQLRRAIEADRFGIAAHVLAERDGCTPDRCAAFAMLHDPGGVRTNLAEHPFEAFVKRYAAGWPAAGGRPVAGNPPPVAAAAISPGSPAKSPNNLYFPSSNSIPPVNIMTAEPPAPAPHDTTGASAAPAPPRKPAAATQPRQPTNPNAAPARAAPMPLAPAQ